MRRPWLLWSLFLVFWTVGLLAPVPHIGPTGDSDDEENTVARFVFAKVVHVTAYAVWTVLTGALPVRPRYRVLLLFVLMAHATLTELGQLTMNQLHWATRTGELRDVALDNLGVLIGIALSWRWWSQEK